MSHSDETLDDDFKTAVENTILVSYLKASSGGHFGDEQIEELESDLENNYCPKRGCEVTHHLKAVGTLLLRFRNLKNPNDEVEHLNLKLPEGVVAAADQEVHLID